MSKSKPKSDTPQERKNLPVHVVTAVLTEAGYRCAVPTCRTILALDLHHMWEVNAGGSDEVWNLIALCLSYLSCAVPPRHDQEGIDLLLEVDACKPQPCF